MDTFERSGAAAPGARALADLEEVATETTMASHRPRVHARDRADGPDPREEASPVGLTRASLDRIGRVNPVVNAFCTVTADQALVTAREAEQALDEGRGRAARSTASRSRSRICTTRRTSGRCPDRSSSKRRVPDDGSAGRAASQAGRRRHARQDDDAGVRLEGARRQPAHGHHAQSLEHGHDDRGSSAGAGAATRRRARTASSRIRTAPGRSASPAASAASSG